MSDLRVSFPKPCGERWEDMKPSGCNRHCNACDKVIHDLSQMTIEEAEALLRVDSGSCVRAKVGTNGVIALRQEKRSTRRLITTLGATATLAACQSLPGKFPEYGNIAGKVDTSCGGEVRVTAEDGRKYTARIGRGGRYVVRYLPYGTYRIEYPEDSEEQAKAAVVTVAAGTVTASEITPENDCIIVGMMSADPESRG